MKAFNSITDLKTKFNMSAKWINFKLIVIFSPLALPSFESNSPRPKDIYN